MSACNWIPVVAVAISGLGTIIGLCAFAYQVRRARFNQSVDLLFRLEGDFFSSNIKKLQRAKAGRDLASGSAVEAEPILDFFETMALLLKRRALDEQMVWHTFFYWVDLYYAAAESFISQRQALDPLVWKDLSHFVRRMRDVQRRRLAVAQLPAHTPEQIAAFLAEEQAEATL